MTEISPAQWGAEYEARRDWFEYYGNKLLHLIVDLLAVAEVDVVKVEYRTKTVDSLVSKISRKSAKYEDPLSEITDLIGLRIIAYYFEDLQRIDELLAKEFEIHYKTGSNDPLGLSSDKLGRYSSHYVVTLSSQRRALPEWKPYGGLKAEIQVRTAIQNAWAAIEHGLAYRSVAGRPTTIRRSIARLAALFELADEQLSQLRDDISRVESEYRYDVLEGQLDIPLDEASVGAYIQDRGSGDAIVKMAQRSGAKIGIADSRRLSADRSDLLELLHWAGISTVAQLDSYLSANILPVPIPAGFFGEGRRSIEDALTLLIMTDLRANREVYNSVYAPEGWDDFIGGVEAWHSRKLQTRAG